MILFLWLFEAYQWWQKQNIIQVQVFRRGTKCLKNQPCDVIKIREIRGEVEKKTSKKDMDNPSFLWRHMAVFWDTLSGYLVRQSLQLLHNSHCILYVLLFSSDNWIFTIKLTLSILFCALLFMLCYCPCFIIIEVL